VEKTFKKQKRHHQKSGSCKGSQDKKKAQRKEEGSEKKNSRVREKRNSAAGLSVRKKVRDLAVRKAGPPPKGDSPGTPRLGYGLKRKTKLISGQFRDWGGKRDKGKQIVSHSLRKETIAVGGKKSHEDSNNNGAYTRQ